MNTLVGTLALMGGLLRLVRSLNVCPRKNVEKWSTFGDMIWARVTK